ncbi:MAG: hypothetical protein KDJ65_00280 [Anaerolineae bacterium]|nr:hypothetical protein [Anaerolineae bacterium]
MPSFNGSYPLRSIVLVLFIASAYLCFIPLTSPVAAQTINIVPVSETGPVTYDCLHMVSLQLPRCRGRLILLLLKRWVETHVEWDTRRWALPVYVEFDQTDRWQRVTLLCLHLNRSAP